MCEVGGVECVEVMVVWVWQVALQEREGELERLRVELEAASESERQQQTRSIDLTHEMEKYSAKMKENAAKARHFMSEVRAV